MRNSPAVHTSSRTGTTSRSWPANLRRSVRWRPSSYSSSGEPYQTLWDMLAKTHGEREAARVVAKLVAAIVAHGEGAVTTALTQVMQSERADLHVVRERLEAVPLPTRIPVPERLAGYEVEAGKARDYDFLLAGELQ